VGGCCADLLMYLIWKAGRNNMKVLFTEKIKVLAEKNDWSLAHAEGYIDGETFRRRGTRPSKYAQIGIDDYCLGFRAGYYERQDVATNVSFRRLPLARG